MTNMYESISDDYREGWKAAKADSQIKIEELKDLNVKYTEKILEMEDEIERLKKTVKDLSSHTLPPKDTIMSFDPTEGNGW